MARNVSIIDFLPQILKETKEIKALNQVENPILEEEWRLVFEQLENQFVSTANEYGIRRYEKMLGIKNNNDDTLEIRRLRILSIKQEQVPYTFKALNSMMFSLLGEGNFTIERDVENKNLKVFVALDSINQINVITEMLERILPVNMNYTVQEIFNSHAYLSGFTHLELMNYTHKQIREEELSAGQTTYDSLSGDTYDYLSSFTYNKIFEGEM